MCRRLEGCSVGGNTRRWFAAASIDSRFEPHRTIGAIRAIRDGRGSPCREFMYVLDRGRKMSQ